MIEAMKKLLATKPDIRFGMEFGELNVQLMAQT